jgi:thiamine-phosphate pyrophosphorylase
MSSSQRVKPDKPTTDPDRVPDFSLYLITDRKLIATGKTLATVVEAALAGGVDAVQLREKDLSAAQLLPLATQLRELTRRFGARLLINDRIDLALAVDADGVHLGGHSLPVATARRLLGDRRLLGVSCHSSAEIGHAAAQGADFVTFGPVYFTPSKAAYGAPQGPAALRAACSASALPVFGLGGITAQRAAEVRSAGAAGIACISAIIAASDPGAAARAFVPRA